MADPRPRKTIIGDDWSFDELLTDPAGGASDLSSATLQVIYFAPGASLSSGSDITSNCSITQPPTSGHVHIVVPRTLTAAITGLPAGRKQPVAHIQVLTTEAGLKTTRLVILVEPIDPSALAPVTAPPGDPDYEPLRFLDGAVTL